MQLGLCLPDASSGQQSLHRVDSRRVLTAVSSRMLSRTLPRALPPRPY